MNQPSAKPLSTADSLAVKGKLDLSHHGEALAAYRDGVRLFTRKTEPRTTASQMLAFAEIAAAHAGGRVITLTDLARLVGEPIKRSYQAFLAARVDDDGKLLLGEDGKPVSNGLGWVEQITDRQDTRKKYLRLTELGILIAEQIATGEMI